MGVIVDRGWGMTAGLSESTRRKRGRGEGERRGRGGREVERKRERTKRRGGQTGAGDEELLRKYKT